MYSSEKRNDLLIGFMATLPFLWGKIASYFGYSWYKTLLSPASVPPYWVEGLIWAFLCVCSAIAFTIITTAYKHVGYYRHVFFLFILCWGLTLLWPYLFFIHQTLAGALINAIVLEFSILTLIIVLWKDARIAALLLLPSLFWVAFEVYLNYQFLVLNEVM